MAQDLAAKVESYAEAWASGSWELVLDFMADDICYSDYLLNHFNMDKAAAKDFLALMGSLAKDIKILTRSKTVSPEQCVWETEFNFTMLGDVPGAPYKDGEAAKTRGVTLMQWNKEGKIVKQDDYYCWVLPQQS